MTSPCFNCTRVRDPKNCENKTCKDWQAWFIDRWETMRDHVRKTVQSTPTQTAGIPLGGNLYAHPHRVREYLQTDPCSHCLYPADQCATPCTYRTQWETSRKEATQ